MKFNERILDLRKKNGWSQEELGYKLNVSRQTISKWEAGQTTPELEKLRNLAKLFNISVDELINEEIIDESKMEKNEVPNAEKISKKKKSKIKTLLIYMFVVLFIFYIVLVVYRYSIILKIGKSFWNIIMESNNNGYYMEERTFGKKFNVGDPMTREEHYYYNNWFDTSVAEEDEIGRVKIKQYDESNLMNPDKIIYIDNIWINSDENSVVTEFDEINKTYKKIDDFEYLSYAHIIMSEYENVFNILDFYEDWPNYLRYAMDLSVDIFKMDEGYYISNERINAPKQENHCYMIINNNKIIFEKINYDSNMKSNYDGTRYKLRLGTTENDVKFPNVDEYVEVIE